MMSNPVELRKRSAPAISPSSELAQDRLGKRLVSLDVFRGATILGMILVNNPGTWGAIYPPLQHAAWHGWTPTDLIFPFFLFIVGVAIPLAYTKRISLGISHRDLIGKATRRALILFGLGLFMAAYPVFTFSPEFGLHPYVQQLRIMGVLQRISVCYLAASLVFLYTRPHTQWWWIGGLLLGYWGVMKLVPVPGIGPGQLDVPADTLSAYLDRLLLGESHLWVGADRRWDPEGLLSTLPAIATTLFGVWTGHQLLKKRNRLEKTVRLLVTGIALVIGGYIWNWFFPINKSLWTSSYALFTAGQAMCALGVCYWLIDVRGHQGWTKPFVVYGVNALTVFVMSGLLARTLFLVKVTGAEGEVTSLQSWIFQTFFLPLATPINASLLYALTWILMWFGILYTMYRRNLIWKV